MKDKLLRKRAWGAAELKLLGYDWSVTRRKGWKKRILKQRGWYEEYQAIQKGTQLPKKIRASLQEERTLPKFGYLVRANMSGRYHLIVNGRTLCRRAPNWKRQIVMRQTPETALCSTCADLQRRDPHNQRADKSEPLFKDKFYSSWEWKKARFEILKRYGAKCMLCGSTHRIVVDHIKPKRFFPDLALDLDNLQVLCDECNRGKSNDDYTDFRPDPDALTESECDELEIVNRAREVMH